MATNLYVVEDGTIHRNPVTVISNTNNRNNVHNRSANNVRTQYRIVLQVIEGRVVWFWFVSVKVSILIGFGVNACLCVSFAETEGDFTSVIGAYAVMVGSLASNILYGIFCAKKIDYNLWAYVLAALSELGGIVSIAIAVAIICVVAIFCFYIFIFAVIISIICRKKGGS